MPSRCHGTHLTALYALVVRCEATRAVALRHCRRTNGPAIGTVRARHLQTKAPSPPGDGPITEVDEETLEELRALAVGKRARERSDSVTEPMIQERINHLLRLRSFKADDEVVCLIERLGLGQKRRAQDVKKFKLGGPKDNYCLPSNLGAQGFATYMGSASGQWPMFKHMLPEVAFAGHSNCGKSSLVNALSGLSMKKGVARVSDRAGWTDRVSFYMLGKKPPILTMADLPGYGHAVAGLRQRRAWRDMIKDYVTTRTVLSRVCVLVDCLRGLCREDRDFINMLEKRQIPFQVVLTKSDLLGPIDLAKSQAVVLSELSGFQMCDRGEGGSTDGGPFSHSNGIGLVSSATGAGVGPLWEHLVRASRAHTVDRGGVAIHKNALR